MSIGRLKEEWSVGRILIQICSLPKQTAIFHKAAFEAMGCDIQGHLKDLKVETQENGWNYLLVATYGRNR